MSSVSPEDRQRYVPRGLSSAAGFIAQSAGGGELQAMDGRSYIDFAGGIGVMNVGHSHPKVIAAAAEQLRLLVHSGAPVAIPDKYVELAKRLAEVTPGDFPKKTLLVNSGAEAVENAVKIVRQATGRPAIISFHNSFHGRTLLTMSLTGKVKPYRQNFGPYAPEVYQVPYPYPYRRPPGVSLERLTDHCLDLLEETLRSEVPAERVAGIVVEPVQGEGGFVVPPPDFLPRLAELCRALSIPLIADEIQTGFGRTGTLFAVEHVGVEPDIIVLAKSIAGGLPLAAIVGRAELMDAVEPGGIGGTFGGNPVACAAALAVLDVMREERLPEQGAELGALALTRMWEWQERFGVVGDVRGLGAMVAMELVEDSQTRTPAPELTARLIKECHSRGLLVIKAGLYDNVVRLLAPLGMKRDLFARGLDILGESLESLAVPATAAAEGPSATAAR